MKTVGQRIVEDCRRSCNMEPDRLRVAVWRKYGIEVDPRILGAIAREEAKRQQRQAQTAQQAQSA